jgi:3-oxosteroid 1-dehydrogenase
MSTGSEPEPAGWDRSVDFVVVGSGGGGLTAALTAAEGGLDTLLLEKQSVVGGSTAMSGGVVWLPNNPLMAEEGVPDSHEAGLAHFAAVVGDIGPASSPERRETFLSEGSRMVDFLRQKGIRFIRCPGYSDYYPDAAGGNAAGRSIEPTPFDARRLGDWQDKVQPGLARGIGLVVKTNELRSIQYYNRSLRALGVAARVFVRTVISRLRRQDLLTNGASLIAQLLHHALAAKVTVWTDTGLEDLVVEDGRVVGVRVVRDGQVITIGARRGVLLAAGGFSRNAEMREKYSAEQPNDARWSISNPGDTGEVLSAAMKLGAQTDLMDEAWWLPMSLDPVLAGSTLGQARQRPGAIFVNSAAQRFVNEANSYMEVGRAMYEHGGVPSWLIIDDAYRRRYVNGQSVPGRFDPAWVESGALKKADTIAGLAVQTGLDVTALQRTIDRFNADARFGRDPDFGRGQSAFNLCMGDPGYKLNAALGPVDRAPFYATQILPADVGTCGGLVTNEHAQVLDEAGEPIPGLYATGNITAALMGRKYLGAGGSISSTMVFGFVAADHVVTSAPGKSPAP